MILAHIVRYETLLNPVPPTAPAEPRSARELTNRLVAGASQRIGPTGLAASPVGAAFEDVYLHLGRTLGTVGCSALLRRALADAATTHPLLAEIRLGVASAPLLGDVARLVEVHGDAETTAALEAALATMFALLGRLIGDDMVGQLVERRAPNETPRKDA